MTSPQFLVVLRRHARELGQREGLSGVSIEALATALTEIARNVLVHARSGKVSMGGGRGVRGGRDRRFVVVVVQDDGPGIADPSVAMVDGYSTGQGLGMGLPGARRLVDAFELRSVVGQGTTMTLEKWGRASSDHL